MTASVPHRPMIRRPVGLLAGLVLASIVACSSIATAQLPNGEPIPPLVEQTVPADNPAAWPEGNFRPIPRTDYARLKRSLTPTGPQPADVQITEAVYEASLSEDVLIDGTLRLTVRSARPNDGFKPKLLPLDPMNIAIESLAWSDSESEPIRSEPALWGTTPAGRTAILVDRPVGAVTGRWSLAGRSLSRGVEFPLQLAPAVVNRLRLHLPTDLSLSSSVGQVEGPLDSDRDGNHLWRVELGSHTRTRLNAFLTETPSESNTPPTPAPMHGPGESRMTVSTATDVVLSRDGVLFRSTLTPQIFDRPRRDLRLRLPARTEIESITYGNDLPLAWRVASRRRGRIEIRVDFPEPVLGAGQPIRLTGRMPLLTPQTFAPPEAIDAIMTGGKLTLEIDRPLELQMLRTEGMRQIGTVRKQTDGEVLGFEVLTPDSELTVMARRPDLVLTERSVSSLRLDGPDWLLETELELQARSGTASDMVFELPVGWDITDLARISPAPQTTQKNGADDRETPAPVEQLIPLDWEVIDPADRSEDATQSQNATDEERSPRLLVRLRNALTPESSVRLTITGRALPVVDREVIPIPVIRSTAAEEATTSLTVTPPEGTVARVRMDGDFRRILPSEYDAVIPTWLSSVGSGDLAPPSDRSVRLVSTDPDPSGWIELLPVPMADEPAGEAELPTLGSIGTDNRPQLILRSELSRTTDGLDLHQAEYLWNGPHREPVRFTLPRRAELLDVRSAGTSLPVRSVSNRKADPVRWIVHPPALTEPTRLTIHYRVPSRDRLWDRRDIPVPRTETRTRSFEWRVDLPEAIDLLGSPAGLLPTRFEPSPHWSAVLFGPLGRDRGEAFHPFQKSSWNRLIDRLTGTDTRSETNIGPETDSSAEREFDLRFTAMTTPQRLRLDLWDRARGVMLAWAILLGSLIGGLILRMRAWSRRGRTGAVWLAGMLITALLLPPVLGQLAGSAFVGGLLAVLIPRRLFDRPRSITTTEDDPIPAGSTQEFRIREAIIGGVFVAMIGGSSWVLAQPAPLGDRTDRTAGPTRSPSPTPTVLIPERADGTPGELVYVIPELAARVPSPESRRSPAASFLISSADYRVELNGDGFCRLAIRYEIVLLAESDRTTVRLPLSGLHLAGEDACRINGEVVPPLRDPATSEVLIELVRPQRPTRDPSGAVIAPRPTADPIRFRVELDTLPQVQPTPTGGRFRIGTPPVTNGRLTWNGPGGVRSLLIETETGERLWNLMEQPSGSALTVRLGRTRHLAVLWSDAAKPQALPAEVEADLSTIAEVHPHRIDYTVRAAYRVLRGQIDDVTWRLPDDAIVRSVTAIGAGPNSGPAAGRGVPITLRGSERSPSVSGLSRLLIEFDQPRREPFIIEARLTVPRVPTQLPPSRERSPEDSDRIIRQVAVIPPLRFGSSDGVDPGVAVTSRQLGLTIPAAYEPSLTAPPPRGSLPLSPNAFLANRNGEPAVSGGAIWRAFTMTNPDDESDLAFDPVGPISVGLARRESKQTATVAQIAQVRERRLDWIFTAQITTSEAPAYRHELRFDPRLRLDSVSVREDRAERLLRWTRRDDRLTVFLEQPTVGSQTLVVRAWLPLELGRPLPLPRTGLASATVTESDLSLYRETDLIVTLDGAPEPLELMTRPITDDAGLVRIGRYPLGKLDPTGRFADAVIIEAVPKPIPLRFDAVTEVTQLSRTEVTSRHLLRLPPTRRRPELITYFLPEVDPERVSVSSPDADVLAVPALPTSDRTGCRIEVTPVVPPSLPVMVRIETTLERTPEIPLPIPAPVLLQTPFRSRDGGGDAAASSGEPMMLGDRSGETLPETRYWILAITGEVLPGRGMAPVIGRNNGPEAEESNSVDTPDAENSGEPSPLVRPADWVFEIEPNWRSDRYRVYVAVTPEAAPRSLDDLGTETPQRWPLWETQLAWDDDLVRGRTRLLVEHSEGERLRIRWPEGAELESVQVDRIELEVEVIDGELALPLETLPPLFDLQIDWSTPRTLGISPLRQSRWSLPTPIPPADSPELRPDHSLFAVLSPAGTDFLPQPGLRQQGGVDFLRRHIAGLLLYAKLHAGERQPDRLLRELKRSRRQLAELLQTRTTFANEDAAFRLMSEVDLLTQGKQISLTDGRSTADSLAEAALISERAFLGEIRWTAPVTESAPTSTEDGDQPPVIEPIDSTANGPVRVSFWVTRPIWIQAILALSGFLLLVPLLMLLMRNTWAEWLGSRPAVGWAMVGFLWWICFRGSAGGLVVLIAAATWGLLGLRHRFRESESEVVLRRG